MAINTKQKQYLRGLAHTLKPVVMLGNSGLTDGVADEVERSLAHHELIKVRISGQEKVDRDTMIEEIAQRMSANLVQVIGHIAVLYRPAKEPVIQLPKK